MLEKELFKAALSIFALLVSFVGSVGASSQTDINGPAGSGFFGWSVVTLRNGNFVVTDWSYDVPTIANIGAVYLYDGHSGQLISTLTGDRFEDRVGFSGVKVLPSGDFLVQSANWHENKGAVTFCSKTTGCSGIVSETNSLIGSANGDEVGLFDINILTNGNYVISSLNWSSGRGAVTFATASSPVKGIVSASNSLVGVTPGDRVGAQRNQTQNGVFALANGNYVVASSAWNDNRGAVTFALVRRDALVRFHQLTVWLAVSLWISSEATEL